MSDKKNYNIKTIFLNTSIRENTYPRYYDSFLHSNYFNVTLGSLTICIQHNICD